MIRDYILERTNLDPARAGYGYLLGFMFAIIGLSFDIWPYMLLSVIFLGFACIIDDHSSFSFVEEDQSNLELDEIGK